MKRGALLIGPAIALVLLGVAYALASAGEDPVFSVEETVTAPPPAAPEPVVRAAVTARPVAPAAAAPVDLDATVVPSNAEHPEPPRRIDPEPPRMRFGLKPTH